MNKECGNCVHLSERAGPATTGLGREVGECQKLHTQRYVTDYCHRWGTLDAEVEGL